MAALALATRQAIANKEASRLSALKEIRCITFLFDSQAPASSAHRAVGEPAVCQGTCLICTVRSVSTGRTLWQWYSGANYNVAQASRLLWPHKRPDDYSLRWYSSRSDEERHAERRNGRPLGGPY